MTKYDEQFKLSVVQQYEAGEQGFISLAAQCGVDRATIRRWVNSYRQHGISGLRKKFSHYSAQFKLGVLQRIQREELSALQAIALFDIRGGAGVITAWQRLYHAGGLPALEPKPRGRRKMSPTKPTLPPDVPRDSRNLEDLRKENEYLRAEVAYLKKLRALLQAKEQAAQKKRK